MKTVNNYANSNNKSVIFSGKRCQVFVNHDWQFLGHSTNRNNFELKLCIPNIGKGKQSTLNKGDDPNVETAFKVLLYKLLYNSLSNSEHKIPEGNKLILRVTIIYGSLGLDLAARIAKTALSSI